MMMELLRRISYLWNRRRLEREMAEEMAYHRELMSPDRRTNFGDDLRLREDAREMWGWTWLDRLHQDLTYGARVLRNAPGFTLTAMLVLVLGIGVPLSAFRVVLTDLQGRVGAGPGFARASDAPRAWRSHDEPDVSRAGLLCRQREVVPKRHRRIGAQSGSLQRGRSRRHARVNPESINVAFATSNYFPEFGIAPALGRVLTPDDERPDAEPAAVIGELFWQRRLGGDPAVIGRSIRVNGKLLRVVGVMPRSAKIRDDVWMPLVRQPYVVEGSTLLTDWNSALDLYGRLRPGVSPQASQQETLALAASLRERWPDRVWKGEYLEARPILEFDSNSEEFRIVLTAAALVLLLLVAACANLGTLVLARGVTREREIRVRMALGAGRLRIVRQLFTESLLLAVLSGLCALLLSTVVLKVMQLQHNSTASLVPDWRALAATFGAAMLAALVFGLPPAFRLASLVPRAGRARPIFLGAQVAVSCLLLVVSSLLVNSRQQLGATDPGFDYRHLVWISPGLKAHGYGGPAAQAYLDLLRARTAALPDVKADIPGLARAVGRPPHGSELDGAPVRGQSRGSAISGHDGDAPRARAQLPAGRRRRGDRQRSDGARAVAGPGCPRQIAPVGSSGPDGDWRRAKRLDRLRGQSRTPGILPAAIAKRRAGLGPAGPCLRLAARFRPTSPGHGPRSRCAAATDRAGGHGYVRPGSGEGLRRARGDRDPGYRGHPALGHRAGRPRWLHRGAAHSRDRTAHRARRPRRATWSAPFWPR